MDVAAQLRQARTVARLTQAQLADRAGTSQATISQYEGGRKQPTIDTFVRLLQATGTDVRVGPPVRPVERPTAAQLDRAGRTLEQVIELAALLPTRHERSLRYPRLDARAGQR